MALAPLGEGDAAAAKGGDAAAEAPKSFRERKLSQLQSEEEPKPGKPRSSAESAEDGYPDDEDPREDLLDDEDDADLDGDADDEDLDDQEAEDEEADEDEDEEDELSADEWREKAENLQRELSRVTENRKKIEADFRNSTAENITFRHQLEDSVEQVTEQGKFWLNLAQSQVQQFENLDWSQVPPDKMAQVKAQAQQAMHRRDQILQRFQAMAQHAEQAREDSKRRQAELSRNVLSTRIEDWSNEKYAQIREHSAKFHFTPDEFNEITDWRIIELLHRDLEREKAVETVQRVKRKRKARVPHNKSQRRPDRSANGRFQSAKAAAHANPGDRSKFREMQRQKLARERGAGR